MSSITKQFTPEAKNVSKVSFTVAFVTTVLIFITFILLVICISYPLFKKKEEVKTKADGDAPVNEDDKLKTMAKGLLIGSAILSLVAVGASGYSTFLATRLKGIINNNVK